jgi:hypothetical protein
MFKLINCKTNENENECCLNKYKIIKEDKELYLSNFDNLKELKFNCKQEINITLLALQPNNPIILDESLDIKNLTITSNYNYLLIILYNFKGIDLISNPFKHLKQGLFFQFTKFDFYVKNKQIDKFNNCNDQMIPNLNIIQQANSITISNSNKNSDINNKETCPFLFKNTFISSLSIRNLKYSLIYKNSFSFQNVSIMIQLNSLIYQTYLEVYHSNLDAKLLNKHVFRNLTYLFVVGVINKIEADTFVNLHHIRLLRIKSQNVKNIFAKNNKWFEFLNPNDEEENSKEKNTLTMFIHQLYENVTYYSYPDEDFCLFKHFPHIKYVFPILTPNSKSVCSCTELFLIRNSFRLKSQIEDKFSHFDRSYFFDYYDNFDNLFADCFNGYPIEDLIKKCKFKERLELCKNNEKKENNNNHYLDVYIDDFMQFSDLIDIVFTKYLNLIFVIISLFINILMVAILSSKSLKKDRMYTYLNINSIFNSLSCLITIIDYIAADCSGHSICPKIRTKEYQYYYVILIKLIGNSIKTCSNISHLSFSLSRYKKIKGKDYIFIKLLNNLSFKLYLLLIVIFSIGINLFVYFKFSIKFRDTLSMPYNYRTPAIDYLSTVNNNNEYNKVNFSDSEYVILNVFQCLKIIFSDLTYIIATTIVDILLFKIVKKQMDNKRKILLNLNQNRTTTATGANNKKKENILSAEYRISRMIILNEINYFIFRFPFAVYNFYDLIFRHDEKAEKHLPNLISFLVCHRFNFCKSIGQIFYFLYLISYFLQFIIFYKLDKNFKESCSLKITKFKKFFISCKNNIQNRC